MKARPTIYNGIQMRSRLEATFAALLDNQGWQWQYEPDAYANAVGQYLPDFVITADGETMVVDVKPVPDTVDATHTAMRVVWSSEPAATLAVAMPDPNLFGNRYPWQEWGHQPDAWRTSVLEPVLDADPIRAWSTYLDRFHPNVQWRHDRDLIVIEPDDRFNPERPTFIRPIDDATWKMTIDQSSEWMFDQPPPDAIADVADERLEVGDGWFLIAQTPRALYPRYIEIGVVDGAAVVTDVYSSQHWHSRHPFFGFPLGRKPDA